MNMGPNNFQKSNYIRYIIASFLIISSIFFALSQFIVWGNLNVETHLGPAEANLDAEFYEHSVNYAITGNMSGGGLIGSIGGGLVGEVDTEIKEKKTFLTGLGDFQENIGIILDSYSDKTHSISTSIWNNNTNEFEDTKITVNTHLDLIPWWPEKMAQKCSVTVTLVEKGYIQEIIINEVKIFFWRNFDEKDHVFTVSSNPIAKTSPNVKLTKLNESRTYNFETSIDENIDRIGIIGVIELTIIDAQGTLVPENTIINLGKSEPIPAGRTNNIYVMSQSQGISIVLMVIATPLTIVSIILAALAIPFVTVRSRKGTWLVLTAAIIGMLSVIFFINGIETLIGLLDSVMVTKVREDFSWSYNLAIPITSVVLLFISFGLALFNQHPKIKAKPGENVKVVEWKKGSKDKKQKLEFKPITGGTGTEVEPLVVEKIRPRKGKRKGKT